MKGIVCSNLYAITDERDLTSNTLAVRELVDGAIAEGLEVTAVLRFLPLIVKGGPYWPRKRVLNGLPVYDVPTIGFRFIYSALLTRLVLFLMGFRGRFHFAICHQSFNFIAAKRVLGRRLAKKYFVVHGSDLGKPQMRRCLDAADKTFVRSHALARQLKDNYDVEPSGIVYSGIDAAEIVDLQSKDISLEGGLVITMASLMIPRKNVQPCLRAFRALVDKGVRLTVHLYGDGPLSAAITRDIEQLGLTRVVRQYGFTPRAEVLKAMRASHLFLMPSVQETFGLVYLEAMASGCVVIGHQGWGIDGVVEEGVNGYLVAAPTEAEIESKIQIYLSAQDREALHRESVKVANANTRDSAVKNYRVLLGPS